MIRLAIGCAVAVALLVSSVPQARAQVTGDWNDFQLSGGKGPGQPGLRTTQPGKGKPYVGRFGIKSYDISDPNRRGGGKKRAK